MHIDKINIKADTLNERITTQSADILRMFPLTDHFAHWY